MSSLCKQYKWQLIQFAESVNENEEPFVDCIPATWITHTSVGNKLLAPFPAPPYTPTVLKILIGKVKKVEDPLSEWPLWPVELRGGAGIY